MLVVSITKAHWALDTELRTVLAAVGGIARLPLRRLGVFVPLWYMIHPVMGRTVTDIAASASHGIPSLGNSRLDVGQSVPHVVNTLELSQCRFTDRDRGVCWQLQPIAEIASSDFAEINRRWVREHYPPRFFLLGFAGAAGGW